MSSREQAIGRIMQAQREMAYLFAFDRSDPLLTAHLTMPQLKILLVLALREGASGQDLTAAMGVSLATITGIVDRLAAQGLVTRREDPRDRRVRRVELSESGKELVDRIFTAGVEHQRRILQHLDEAALGTVERAIRLMLDAAKAEQRATAGRGTVETVIDAAADTVIKAAADTVTPTPGGVLSPGDGR